MSSVRSAAMKAGTLRSFGAFTGSSCLCGHTSTLWEDILHVWANCVYFPAFLWNRDLCFFCTLWVVPNLHAWSGPAMRSQLTHYMSWLCKMLCPLYEVVVIISEGKIVCEVITIDTRETIFKTNVCTTILFSIFRLQKLEWGKGL